VGLAGISVRISRNMGSVGIETGGMAGIRHQNNGKVA